MTKIDFAPLPSRSTTDVSEKAHDNIREAILVNRTIDVLLVALSIPKSENGDMIPIPTTEESHEVAEPSIDSHIVKLKSLNPDVVFIIATPKFPAQSIKKTAELSWRPLQIVVNVSASLGAVMKPAGLEASQDVLSAAYAKDGADSQWDNDPGMMKWSAFVDKCMPGGNKTDANLVYGYGVAQTLVKTLQMCGDDLTRANVMKQAASLKDFAPDTLLPGVTINTSPTNFAPIAQLKMQHFKGEKWELFGDVISGNPTTN